MGNTLPLGLFSENKKNFECHPSTEQVFDVLKQYIL